MTVICLLQTSGKGDLLQAVAGNIGPVNARKMLPFYGEDEDFKVSGYTSLPELTRSNRNYLSIFINGRPIRNMAIGKSHYTRIRFNIDGGTIPDYDYFD